jgi:hypothetical protein
MHSLDMSLISLALLLLTPFLLDNVCLQLDASVHHRDAFLSQLHASQKHLWTFLHDQPVQICYGFTGTSLAAVELATLWTRMEAKLVEQLKRQKSETKSRYAVKRPPSLPNPVNPALSADIAIVVSRVDSATTYIGLIDSSSAPLLTSADAHHIYSVIRRMSELTHLWGTYLHSDASNRIAVESTSQDSSDTAEEQRPTHSSSSSSLPPTGSSSHIDRAWDEIATGWARQYHRLTQLEHFWSRMTDELAVGEKAATMRLIARNARMVDRAPTTTPAPIAVAPTERGSASPTESVASDASNSTSVGDNRKSEENGADAGSIELTDIDHSASC